MNPCQQNCQTRDGGFEPQMLRYLACILCMVYFGVHPNLAAKWQCRYNNMLRVKGAPAGQTHYGGGQLR